MFSAEQYRAKAIAYSKLARITNSANEVREFQRLERSFTELANNAQWMTDDPWQEGARDSAWEGLAKRARALEPIASARRARRAALCA